MAIIFRDNDLFIVSYPRSGNYWLRFLLTTYLHGVEIHWNNFKKHCPMIYHTNQIKSQQIKSPRIFGSHEPEGNYPSVIYLYRDPRDVVISQYYYNYKMGHLDGDFDSFFDNFISDDVSDRPSSFGHWEQNVNNWLDKADMVLSYEQMQEDVEGCLLDILRYFNYEIKKDKLNDAIEWCDFENMKKLEHKQNHLSNTRDVDFIRKGKSKQWKDFLTSDQKKRIVDTFFDVMEELDYL